MMKLNKIAIAVGLVTAVGMTGCTLDISSESKDAQRVERQQEQFAIGQPVPTFDWSLERHLLIQLYMIRNQNVATHSVWRSDYGMVEGDCPSMGYGLPYDTSITNPLVATDEDRHGYDKAALAAIEQAEPNGIFASKNTNATWVFCVEKTGTIAPVYVESKVTAYPGPVTVDYETNRVKRIGAANFTITEK